MSGKDDFYDLTTEVQTYSVVLITGDLVDATGVKVFTVKGRTDPLLNKDGHTLRETMIRSHYSSPQPLRTTAEWIEWATAAYTDGIEDTFGSKALHEASIHAYLPQLLRERVHTLLSWSMNEAERRLLDDTRPVDATLASWLLQDELPSLYEEMNVRVGLEFMRKALDFRDPTTSKVAQRIMRDIHVATDALSTLLDGKPVTKNFTKGMKALRASVARLDAMVAGKLITPKSVLEKALESERWINPLFRDHTDAIMLDLVLRITAYLTPLIQDPLVDSMSHSLENGDDKIDRFDSLTGIDLDAIKGVAQNHFIGSTRGADERFVTFIVEKVATFTLGALNYIWDENGGDINSIIYAIGEPLDTTIAEVIAENPDIQDYIQNSDAVRIFSDELQPFRQTGRQSLLMNVRDIKAELAAWYRSPPIGAVIQWADLLRSIDASLRSTLGRLLVSHLSINETSPPVFNAITDFLATLRTMRPQADGTWTKSASRHWAKVRDHIRYLLMGRWSTFDTEKKTVRQAYTPDFWNRQVSTVQEDQAWMSDPEIRALNATLEKNRKMSDLQLDADRLYETINDRLLTIEQAFIHIRTLAPRDGADAVGLGMRIQTVSVARIHTLRKEIARNWEDVRAASRTLRSTYDEPLTYNLFFAEMPQSGLSAWITDATAPSKIPTVKRKGGYRQSPRKFVRTFITDDLLRMIIDATEVIASRRNVAVYEEYPRGVTSRRYHSSTRPPLSGNPDPRFAIPYIERQDVATGHFYYQPTTNAQTDTMQGLFQARRRLDQKLGEQVAAGERLWSSSEAVFFDLVRHFADTLRRADGKNGVVFYGGQAETNGMSKQDVGDGDFAVWWKSKKDTKPLSWLHRISFWVGLPTIEAHNALRRAISSFNQVERARDGLHFVEGRFTDLSDFTSTTRLPVEIDRSKKSEYRVRIDFYCIDVTPAQSSVITQWERFLVATQKFSSSLNHTASQFALGVSVSDTSLALGDLDTIMIESHTEGNVGLFETMGSALGPAGGKPRYGPFSLEATLTQHRNAISS